MERHKESYDRSDSDKEDSLICSSKDNSYSSYEITSSSQCSSLNSSSCNTVPSSESYTSCETSSSCVTRSSYNSLMGSCYTSELSDPSCHNSVVSCSSLNSESCNYSSCDKSYTDPSCSRSSDYNCKSSTSCFESCGSYSQSNMSCIDSCDYDSCYNPHKNPESCPEDCGKVKCEEFNIYWFGSSLSDIGNGRCNLGLEPYTVPEEITIPPFQLPIINGYGPCGRQSDGNVYPHFIAKDLDFRTHIEYDLCELPLENNNLVSFSLAGSTQTDNIIPNVPENSYGYNFQVNRFLELYRESSCYAIPEKDIFFYTGVGINTLLELVRSGETPQPDYFQKNLVDPAVENIKRLYSEGKARTMFVQLIDIHTIMLMPLYQKLISIPGIDDIFTLYDTAIHELKDALNDFARNQIPRFNLTVILSHDLYDQILTNPGAFGSIPDETMIDLGWPQKVFTNQVFFDDIHTSSHSNRIIANFVKTWFQQKVC